MWLLSPKYQVTEVSPKLVAFFFSQYCELMKHGKDRTDLKMKDYLFSVITGLGVPQNELELVEDFETETLPDVPVQLPIINRRN